MKRNIAALPMDSRPCSTEFMLKIGRIAGYEINSPPLEWYWDFIGETDEERMAEWLTGAAKEAEYLVVSVDMLLFGGLATALRHRTPVDLALKRLELLRTIKREKPSLILYAAFSIPGSSNSAYTPYELITRSQCMTYSQLAHKILLDGREEDKAAMEEHMKTIDRAALEDYLAVRERAQAVGYAMIDMAAEGVIDFISFGVNDCSVYGLHRVREQELLIRISEKMVPDKAIIYTGADEQCQVLSARAMLHDQKKEYRFFTRYSSTGGENLIPAFDDGPIGNNLRAQAFAMGCVVVDTPVEADAIILVNSPCESSEDYRGKIKFNTPFFLPDTRHNLWDMMSALRYYQRTRRRVAVADVAFCNGSDVGLVRYLKHGTDLTKLTCYSGWNTSSNTIGTLLSHLVSRILFEESDSQSYESEIAHHEFMFERFGDECFYQVVVRPQIINRVREIGETDPGCSTVDFGDHFDELNKLMVDKMTPYLQTFFDGHYKGKPLSGQFAARRIASVKLTLRYPWRRTFETRVDAKFTTEV